MVCLGIWWVIAKRMVCSEVVVRIRSRLMVVLLSVANPEIASADTAEKLNSYLCDTRAAAVDFAVAAADGTEETARDFVNKKEHREACNRYVGFASVEERGTATINGAVFRTTRISHKLLGPPGRSICLVCGTSLAEDRRSRSRPQAIEHRRRFRMIVVRTMPVCADTLSRPWRRWVFALP